MKQKKTYTPQQQIRRFYFAAGFIALLVLICVIPTRKAADRESMEQEEITDDSISEKMDSLLTLMPLDSIFGENTVIKEKHRWWKELVTNPNVEEIDMLRKLIADTGVENEWAAKIRAEMQHKLDSLVAGRQNPDDRLYYARWITVRSGENKKDVAEYNAMQYCDTLLTESRIYVKSKVEDEKEKKH